MQCLVCDGSPAILVQLRKRQAPLIALAQLPSVLERGRDRAPDVRRRAKILARLLSSDRDLAEARQRAALLHSDGPSPGEPILTTCVAAHIV